MRGKILPSRLYILSEAFLRMISFLLYLQISHLFIRQYILPHATSSHSFNKTEKSFLFPAEVSD